LLLAETREKKGPKSQVPLCHPQLCGKQVKTERNENTSQRCKIADGLLRPKMVPEAEN